MFAIQFNTAPFAFVTDNNGAVRTWAKRNSALKFRSTKGLDATVVDGSPEAWEAAIERGLAEAAAADAARKAELDAAAAAAIAESDAAVESDEDAAALADLATFSAAFTAAGGNEPRGTYRAIRRVARTWEGDRNSFVAAAEAYGIIRRSARIEYNNAFVQAD